MGQPIPLFGCRHDVLGHALKAIGTLRVLAQCAPSGQRDPDAEGWWDLSDGCFKIALSGDHDEAWLKEFFESHYTPTPVIAAWNKSGGVTDKLEVKLEGGSEEIKRLRDTYAERLKELGLKPTKRPVKDGSLKFAIESRYRQDVLDLVCPFQLEVSFCKKASGKKDGVIPGVAELPNGSRAFGESLELARQFAAQFRDAGLTDAAKRDLLATLRDRFDDPLAEAFDALSVLHLSRIIDNPLFLSRGRPGDKVNADIFLNFWEYFLAFKRSAAHFFSASLLGQRVISSGGRKDDSRGKGTPFFPDAIKTYNQGLDWVTEELPFCPLDYLLAVEGALAMRGATSKSLAAQSRARGAFPFVFETSDALVDEQGKQLALASAFWFPIWERRTTFAELQSFILDAQARLASKDCRFSTDFARAIVGLGVDAGFSAFQEFRFKLKTANVPWTTAGRFVRTSSTRGVHPLSELLGPLDTTRFLEQFRFDRTTRRNLHPLSAPVFDAIDVAVAEPSAPNLLEILCRLADLNRQLALSKNLRERVSSARYVPPLPCEAWESALWDLERDPEFQIARALASMIGHEAQADGKTFSEVEPFLGSVLPLKRRRDSWYLPTDPPSAQAVWAGADLFQDLASILARRHQESIDEDRPALAGSQTAPLSSILAFLRGELNDRRVARLSVALGHIGWSFKKRQRSNRTPANTEQVREPIPTAYAALRGLVEVGLEGPSSRPHDAKQAHRRSPRAITLLCQRTPHAMAAGVGEALRRLAVVGVPNCYDEASRSEKSRLCGRDVISLSADALGLDVAQAPRLAAAVLVPLDFRDRWKIFRAITLPQTAND